MDTNALAAATDAKNPMIWVCRVCCTIGVEIETWIGKHNERFLCKNCCDDGSMDDLWSPIQVTEEEEALYWYEFQNDSTFLRG